MKNLLGGFWFHVRELQLHYSVEASELLLEIGYFTSLPPYYQDLETVGDTKMHMRGRGDHLSISMLDAGELRIDIWYLMIVDH